MKTLKDFPDLCAQIHPDNGDDFKPDALSCGSNKKLKWLCPIADDHEWESSIKERALSGRGCPFCAGKRVSKTNSLASLYPEIASLWHPSKNGELTPSKVTSASKKKVWWKCPKGHDHEWITDIGSKVRSACPFCSGKRVSVTNCLKTVNAKLAVQWHQTLNGSLTPLEVTSGSSKKVWWQCDKEETHYWQATVASRSIANQGCPFCSNKRVCITNNLSTCFPAIAKQWHPTKNGILTPDELTGGSNKKVWWKCDVGADHVWKAAPHGRTTRGDGCPYCGPSPKYASSTHNLELKYPELAKQWHPNMNGTITPKDVLPNTTKKFWWLCEKGHHFKSNCNQRVSARVTCPYCSGYRIGQGNSFADKFPEAASEWDFAKNGNVTPDKIAPFSDKKRWFVCKLGHSYQTAVKYRARGTGCPHCTNQSSQQELRIYAEFKWLLGDVSHKHKIGRVELDIFVPSLNLAVEFDGAYWHRDSQERDKRKNDLCRRKGIKLVRVRQAPLKKIKDTDIIVLNRQLIKSDLDSILKQLFFKIHRIEFADNRLQKYFAAGDFLNDALYEEYKTYLPLPHPSKSLAARKPDLINFWDYEKNHPLKPEHFTIGSNRKVFWVCKRGHSYQSAIVTRVKAVGCPVCYKNRGKGLNKYRTIHDKRQANLF